MAKKEEKERIAKILAEKKKRSSGIYIKEKVVEEVPK
jgi:hypothetical protein